MGARSPPEGYRVAVARYGLPVLDRGKRAASFRVLAPVVPAAVVLLAACGVTGGSKSSGSDHREACAYVAKLDEIASGVATADVHDPVAFKKTLDTAVHDYVTNVTSLQGVAPSELHASLDRVKADVQQYRFSAAVTDRADLDAYAARTCGRTLAGASTTTTPGSAGSVPVTSTTIASATDSSTPTSSG